MALRVKEHLAIPNIHGRGALEIVHGKIKIILLGFQDLEPAVISLEEGQGLFGVIHPPSVKRLHGIRRGLQFLKG